MIGHHPRDADIVDRAPEIGDPAQVLEIEGERIPTGRRIGNQFPHLSHRVLYRIQRLPLVMYQQCIINTRYKDLIDLRWSCASRKNRWISAHLVRKKDSVCFLKKNRSFVVSINFMLYFVYILFYSNPCFVNRLHRQIQASHHHRYRRTIKDTTITVITMVQVMTIVISNQPAIEV